MFWYIINETYRKKANQVLEHFDFMIERIFSKLAQGGHIGIYTLGAH